MTVTFAFSQPINHEGLHHFNFSEQSRQRHKSTRHQLHPVDRIPLDLY